MAETKISLLVLSVFKTNAQFMTPLQTLDYDSLLVSIGVPQRSKTSKKCVKDPFKVISKQYFMISARELKAHHYKFRIYINTRACT